MLIAGLLHAGTFVAAKRAAASESAWHSWKARYLDPSGRVMDRDQQISHSEGQAYGLLLAQAFGDRDAFSKIEAWTVATLVRPDAPFMGWRFDPGSGSVDNVTATDGDLLRAWALLRAMRDSGWQEFAGRADAVAHAIAARCLAPDPRAPAERLLLPQADAAAGGRGRITINPSYFVSVALRELGAAFDLPDLVRAADHGETVLAELAARGAIPDWIDVAPEGFRAPANHAARSGYDALRIPLYLCWSGRRDHPAVGVMAAALARAPTAGHVAVVTDPGGTVVSESDAAGYRAIQALSVCDPLPAAGAQRFYYPATLWLLALVAQREGDDCG
ncbi:glycosyl hydrolase family 8 [Palleronia pelagia]|uniref:glycosyl hydrolase family 8 n=1 Tax=Palleronia pelagia TaxID=387096 RepID=UPI001EEE7ECB|nr:glycosyl hydrolase family 8 [Palleronia pelagia]